MIEMSFDAILVLIMQVDRTNDLFMLCSYLIKCTNIFFRTLRILSGLLPPWSIGLLG